MAISHEAGPSLDILPVPSPIPTLTFARPRRASVSRAALVQRLVRGTERKVTTVVAPAGWGKTSLLAEWMTFTDRPVAWLPLEVRDDDPSRGLRLIATAINQAVPGLANDVIGALRTPYIPAVETIMSLLIDAMRVNGTNLVLVIDDLHHIHDHDLLQGIRILINDAPATVGFILGSRVDPPFNLSRWRVQGEVTDIRIDDLRFDADEATALFALQSNASFERTGIDTIVERTEGWAAGIQIAALTLRGGENHSSQLPDIRGTQREVAGFLCEEVFICQSPEMQEFLLQMSVFEKLSGPFGDAVLQRTDTQILLEQATNANLFVVPCNCSQNMYRIHQLFRDYLRAELQRRHPQAEIELHRRAASWLIEHNQPMEAIDHLIAAGETEQSLEVIDQISTNMVLTSEHTRTFLHWIERFPRDVVVGKPRMLRFYVQALTLTGRLADAESLVRAMEGHSFYQSNPASPDNDLRQAEMLAVRSRISAYRGDNERTVALAEAALAKLGSTDLAWQASLHLDLGWAWRDLGRLDQSAAHFAHASRLGWESGSLQPALWGTRYLALSWIAQGRLREASSLIDAELERARSLGEEAEAVQACLLISRGEILHELYRLSEARTSLERGIALATRTTDAKILMNGYVALALIEQAEGHRQPAMLMLRRGTRIFAGPQEVALQICLDLGSGQLASAVRWARESGLTASDDLLLARAPAEQITFAKVLIATNRLDEAIDLLERLATQSDALGWHGRSIELRVQLALALRKRGAHDLALGSLELAIGPAAAEGYARVFVEAGPDIFGLLRDLMRSRPSIDRDFVTRLLTLRSGSGEHADPSDQTQLAERLTERQLDVLRLLAAGRSNRLIAEELFLAEGTIKAHVHQISAKLMVRNRTEAVARARELGLLPA